MSKDVTADEKPAMLAKKAYFKPALMSTFLHKKFGMFGSIVGFYYIVQFICCVAACNFYSDIARFDPCTKGDMLITGEDASAVFDTAIKLAGVFHVIEWIRTTLLLTIICIGVNLMKVWYVTAISALYGIGVFIYVMAVLGSEDGMACAEAQPYRRMWLVVEVIYFWVLFFFYQAPFLLALCFKKERLHEIMHVESEQEEE
jgi:hypothetical protein